MVWFCCYINNWCRVFKCSSIWEKRVVFIQPPWIYMTNMDFSWRRWKTTQIIILIKRRNHRIYVIKTCVIIRLYNRWWINLKHKYWLNSIWKSYTNINQISTRSKQSKWIRICTMCVCNSLIKLYLTKIINQVNYASWSWYQLWTLKAYYFC